MRFLDAAQMEKLHQAIASPTVIAIAHVYPTFFDTVESTIQPALLVATTHGFVDNGFVRLSEWTATEP